MRRKSNQRFLRLAKQRAASRIANEMPSRSKKTPEKTSAKNAAAPEKRASKNPLKTPPFRAASLFTGIGGFDLGFEKAGFEITFQCELDKFCRCILQHRWPETPIHENIKDLASTSCWVFAAKAC